MPVPYQVDLAIKQIIAYNFVCLRITDNKGNLLKDTDLRILIKQLLLRRIDIINHGTKNTCNKIKFERLYAMAGKERLSDKETQRIREYVEQCLIFWARTGHIKDWDFYPKTGAKGWAGIVINPTVKVRYYNNPESKNN